MSLCQTEALSYSIIPGLYDVNHNNVNLIELVDVECEMILVIVSS